MALADYLVINLGEMATYLSWTAEGDEITQIVEDTLEILGLDLEADSADAVALKAVGSFVAWTYVCKTLVVDFDYKTDKEDFKRSQMFQNAKEMLKMAKVDASPYMPSTQISIGELTFSEDPYVETELTEFDVF
jgi:hypothetical protein